MQNNVRTTTESKQNKGVYKKELYDVNNHASEGYLQRSEVWVHTEYVHQF